MRPIASVILFALAGCEAKIGKGEEGRETANVAAPVSAVGKAEEGRFSIDAPGFNLKVDIPAGMAEQAQVDSDSEIIYPGSKLSGMHVEAGAHAKGQENSGVELRFTSTDDPGTIAAWYRDPARANGFTVTSARKEGEAYVIAGTQSQDNDDFTVHLAPRSSGGTDARLVLAQRG